MQEAYLQQPRINSNFILNPIGAGREEEDKVRKQVVFIPLDIMLQVAPGKRDEHIQVKLLNLCIPSLSNQYYNIY